MTDQRPLHAARFDALRVRPDTLGASFDGEGTTFALFSDHTSRVEFCLYDDAGQVKPADGPQALGWQSVTVFEAA